MERETGRPRAVAIAGMHRSGTSMVAAALGRGGLHLGDADDFVPPAPDNPKGFYEHSAFQRLNDDLLQATGGAWDHPPEAPPLAADDPRVERFRERGDQLVAQLSSAGATWGWKDPRTSLTARYWLDLVPGLLVVVCVRNPLEVALSLKRRNQMSYAHALSLWHTYHAALLDDVPEERCVVTHYDAHFEDAAGELARLLRFAGLDEAGAPEAAEVREAELRHHDLRLTLEAAGVDPATAALYDRLCEAAGRPARPGDGVPATPAQVDRNALDLELANVELARRAQQVASLKRERPQLSKRVARLEELMARGGGPDGIARRLDALEDHQLEETWRELERAGRQDVAALRACRALVREHVPVDSRLLVVTKGDPAWLDLGAFRTESFPADERGEYPGHAFAHGISAIAHLEARRCRGSAFLLIPEPSAWWREHYPAFASHVSDRYETLADVPGAGMLVDLRERRVADDAPPRTVPEAVLRLAAPDLRDPSILDWSGGGVAAMLPGSKVLDHDPGEMLPFLDATIDVVVLTDDLEDASRRLGEARRVATRGVVVVRRGPDGRATVAHVERLERAAAPQTPIRFVLRGPDVQPGWRARLQEALDGETGVEIVDGATRWRDVVDDGAIIALADEAVLPLPGCCDVIRATLAGDEAPAAVAIKLLAADGTLVAAGTTVFADGSTCGVGAGAHDVAAPWHEYVRPVCGGAGLLFVSGAAAGALPARARVQARSATGWAAEAWAAGGRVVYQPDAVAVRAALPKGPGDAADEGWEPVRELRPDRPAALGDREWRMLLAADDVEAAWRQTHQYA